MHRYFVFPKCGVCFRICSGFCLSWFALLMQHGTSATAVVDNRDGRVYFLGLSDEAPVTVIAWGESKPKSKHTK